ncbi:MAG: hypothetical protein ACR2FH_00075 [Caulobacteraceae bacterium]
MRTVWTLATSGAAFAVAGCAGLQFNGGSRGDALTFFDPAPYLLVTVTPDCASTASVITLPGAKRSVNFHNGYGSAALSVTLSSAGTLTTVGQTTDTQIPQTLSAVAGLATAAAPFAVRATGTTAPAAKPCPPTAKLFPIDERGVPDQYHPIVIPADAR